MIFFLKSCNQLELGYAWILLTIRAAWAGSAIRIHSLLSNQKMCLSSQQCLVVSGCHWVNAKVCSTFCWSKTQCLSAPRRKRPRWERFEVGPESQHTYDDVYSARRLRNVCICWFPEIGVPPNHPFLDGIFPNINHPFLGYPHDYGNPHIVQMMK